ncbi:hypothetical protein AKJ41_06525 [candidate division MSBL1 archaeon SCGC-AAA259O05]|uniref:ParB/Sulfiredoxin domain-containing protein n=1 Tax=candidate division MSBL1 archaeon SCGC-AAA259O05 TaxID=1698271 RepID=A0A133UWG2_9EURY|nr:hypothetical protein AKJ41_06525 [candidate division MSBL1 archaeon SCGC-AAA259O05]
MTIYPREKLSSETVKSFVDSLEAGYADFPKIRVQRLVLESGEEELAIIDGVHRRDAYQEYNKRVDDKKKIEKVEAEPVVSEDPVPKSEHLGAEGRSNQGQPRVWRQAQPCVPERSRSWSEKCPRSSIPMRGSRGARESPKTSRTR